MKLRKALIIGAIMMVSAVAMSSLSAAYGKQVDLANTYGFSFPDVSDDGKTYVALDAWKYSYPSTSTDLPVVVATKDAKGNWKKARAIAANGTKSSNPYFATHPVISGDGRTIAYMGADIGTGARYLYESTKGPDGRWSKPRRIETVEAGWHSDRISINRKGNVLAYSIGGGFFGGPTALKVVRKTASGWGEPEKVEFKTGYYSHFDGVLDDAGDTMVFSIMGSQSDLYVADYANGRWGEPHAIAEDENDQRDARISGDGNTIVYYTRYMDGSVVDGRTLHWVKRAGSSSAWSVAGKITGRQHSQLNDDSPVVLSRDGNSLARIRYVTSRYTDGSSYLSGSQILHQTYSNGAWSQPRVLARSKSDIFSFIAGSSSLKQLVYQHYASLASLK